MVGRKKGTGELRSRKGKDCGRGSAVVASVSPGEQYRCAGTRIVDQ